MSQAALTHMYHQCLALLLPDTTPQYTNTLQLSSSELIYDHLATSSVIISEAINPSVITGLWREWTIEITGRLLPSWLFLSHCGANYADVTCVALRLQLLD